MKNTTLGPFFSPNFLTLIITKVRENPHLDNLKIPIRFQDINVAYKLRDILYKIHLHSSIQNQQNSETAGPNDSQFGIESPFGIKLRTMNGFLKIPNRTLATDKNLNGDKCRVL